MGNVTQRPYPDYTNVERLNADIQAQMDSFTSSLADMTTQSNGNKTLINEQSTSKLSKYNTGAVITFVDDDGNNKFLTKVKPLYDSKGIKCDIGVITDRVDVISDYMKTATLKSLQSEGFNIVSHSANHLHLDTLNDTDLRYELGSSLDYIKRNGFNHIENVLISPYTIASTAVTIKNVVREYYNYAFVSNGSTQNPKPLDNYNVNRILVDTRDITLLKGDVDTALSKGNYLVFFTHSGDDVNFPDTNIQKLSDLIDYIKSKNIPILTSYEALQYKGNSVFTGEYTTGGVQISKDNSSNILTIQSANEIMPTKYSGITTQTQLDGYLDITKPVNTWYRFVVSLSASLSLSGGIWYIEGYQASDLYGWQKATTYASANQAAITKTRVLNNGSWGTWV